MLHDNKCPQNTAGIICRSLLELLYFSEQEAINAKYIDVS